MPSPSGWVPVQPLLDAVLIEALARRISVYDMTYLDVARRHKAVGVTADDGLAVNGARENLAIHVRDYHPWINARAGPRDRRRQGKDSSAEPARHHDDPAFASAGPMDSTRFVSI